MIVSSKIINIMVSTIEGNVSILVALTVCKKMHLQIQQTAAHKSWNL